MHVPHPGCRAVRLLNHRQLKNSRLLLPQGFRLALLVGFTLARRHFAAPVWFHPHVGVAREHCPEDVPASAHDGLETGVCVRIAAVQSARSGSPFGRWWFRRPRHRTKTGRRPPGGGPQQDTVLLLSCLEAQKLRFQRPGPLRCAPWSFPPGVGKLAGPVSAPPARLLPIRRPGNPPLPQLPEGRQRRRNLQSRFRQTE